MIPVQFDYAAPESLDEVVRLLGQRQDARVLAGGLGLINSMKGLAVRPSLLVDLRKIPSLAGIGSLPGGGVRIGATTTLAEAAEAPLVRELLPALAEALEAIGDPQVRHRGTVGGSVVQAEAGDDLPAVVLALRGTINVAGPGGTRSLSADEFYGGAAGLKREEVITSVDFPAPPARAGSSYVKFKNPASGYALCGVAALVELAADGTVEGCGVAITGAASHAARLRRVEASLVGKKPTEGAVAAAAACVAAEGLDFRTDLAASGEYRGHLAQVLAGRALARALERAAIS